MLRMPLVHSTPYCSTFTSKVLRVDGGLSVNNWFSSHLANILVMEVARSVCAETNAIGVAYLAGLQTNICASLGELTQTWQSKRISLKTDKQYRGSRV